MDRGEKLEGNLSEGKYKQRDKNSMICIFTNLRSIMNANKRGEMGLMLQERNVDIFGITESWTHEGIDDKELEFRGYHLYRRDRRGGTKKRGGRVLLYVRKSFPVN